MNAFQGGKKAKAVTRKHTPLIWECMLGAVYAMSPAGKVKYFDYDYAAAHAFAQVAQCSDLRIARNMRNVDYTDGSQLYEYGPRLKKFALWGVRPTNI